MTDDHLAEKRAKCAAANNDPPCPKSSCEGCEYFIFFERRKVTTDVKEK